MPMPMPMPLPLNSTENKWSPYSSAKDFDENMVMILIVLVLATILAFSLPAAARLLLRLLRRRQKPRAQPPKPDGGPPATQLFSSADGAGEGVECAICLAEFADGDRVRVLPACSHGFHVACVGQWLVANSSCPTCRRSCRPERSSDEP